MDKKTLQTPSPLGFNDSIHHEGNISKMTDFDVLSLLESRKRKSRSHGIRKKGDDKRKRCASMKLNTCLNDLAVKLREHGRHSMLSYLSFLPFAVYVPWTQKLTDFTIMKCALLHNMLYIPFVHLTIPNLIMLDILLKFLSLIKELTLLIYQAYSRINQ